MIKRNHLYAVFYTNLFKQAILIWQKKHLAESTKDEDDTETNYMPNYTVTVISSGKQSCTNTFQCDISAQSQPTRARSTLVKVNRNSFVRRNGSHLYTVYRLHCNWMRRMNVCGTHAGIHGCMCVCVCGYVRWMIMHILCRHICVYVQMYVCVCVHHRGLTAG